MDFLALSKHTLTFCTSAFEVVSDILNSLDFMGHDNPMDARTSIESITSLSFINQSKGMNMSTEKPNDETRRDWIWGSLSMLIVFLPGLILGLALIIPMISD